MDSFLNLRMLENENFLEQSMSVYMSKHFFYTNFYLDFGGKLDILLKFDHLNI